MRELNEQELDQVVGGSGHGWNHNHGTQATAGGGASADYGFAFSQSVTESIHSHGVSESFAANVSFAIGKNAQAYSYASSSGGATSAAS
jgi:bacteriocin-like protein